MISSYICFAADLCPVITFCSKVNFLQPRKVSVSTRGLGGEEGEDNMAFTDSLTSEDVNPPPYMDYDNRNFGRRKLSRMETQAKFEDLRKR